MSYWMPVAAAAAIVMAFSFQFARNYQEEEFYFDVAGEIAMRHKLIAISMCGRPLFRMSKQD